MATQTVENNNTETETKTERLSVNVSPATATALRDLSKERGVTMTETIRRAVAVLKLLDEAQARGDEIHLYDPETESKRIIYLL